MTFERLVREQRVVREPTARDEIEELRALVRRYLADAAIEELSPDGRFERAYGAARTLATMVVRASGYRVRQPGAHYNTFLALEAADPKAFADYVAYFDICRTLRNELSYESAEVISETELAEILRKVPEFKEAGECWVTKNHPELGRLRAPEPEGTL